jgi:hypothetical protein
MAGSGGGDKKGVGEGFYDKTSNNKTYNDRTYNDRMSNDKRYDNKTSKETKRIRTKLQ